jgi:hypothetical protein
MDQKPSSQSTPTSESIKDDVLHSTGHTHLSQEEIAKAVEHHNRHHPKNKVEMSGKSGGKSPGGAKKGK